MIAVSEEFKEAMRSSSRKTTGYIDNAGEIIDADGDLKSLKITSEAGICRTLMRSAEASFFGDHSLLGQFVDLVIGVVLPQLVDKGPFTVTIASPGVATMIAHGLITGDKVKISTDDALPTGLEPGIYYIIKIDNDTFRFASSYYNSQNNVPINTSGTQSGTHSLKVYTGAEGDTEYINYGKFKVVDPVKIDQATSITTIKMFDLMYESLQDYDITPTFPMSLVSLLEEICDRLGWTLATTTFPNSTETISSDVFEGLGLTYRDILDDIAEASGSIIYFNIDNELVVKQISDTIEETLDKRSLKVFKVEAPYGPINSVVLSRMPQEDNIVQSS
jgi:hypothetical protein